MWEFKRKLIYALSLLIFVGAVAVFLMRGIIFPEPTCFDGKANGFESGLDCGGSCQLMCKESIVPLTVVWAKAIPSGKNVYDLVALVSNSNIDNASREVGYTFNVFDAQGTIFKSLSGSTTVPLDGKIPLIIQGIELAQAPVNVTVELTDGPHYKVLESPTSPTVKVIARRYEAGSIPRIYATIANTKLLEIMNLPVRTLLFDKDDNVYAVGQTVIPNLPKEGVQEIIFTWDEPLPFAPTRIGIYPIFDPFVVLRNY